MIRPLSIFFGAMVLLASVAESAVAEEFSLTNGGNISGELLNPDQQPRTDYLVRLSSGAQIRLGKEIVRTVASKPPRLLRYEQLLPRMPDTVEGNWKMAEWCKDNGLSEQRDHHLNEIIKRQPDHEPARQALGYRKIDSRWMKIDEYMKKQGYVRFQGAWRIRQEVELENNKRKIELASKEWRRQLRIWRTWLLKGRRQQEALDRFAEIKDPLASPALAEMLKNEENPELKKLLIDTLSRLQSPAAIVTFIQLALQDPDASIRDKCLDELARFAKPSAVLAFTKSLKHKDNKIVNRAAVGLSVMGDPEATLPLIEALITKHKFQVNTGGGLSTTFGQQGGGGLNVGGGPKIVEQQLRNESVLAALRAVNPTVNYVYDQAAWKAWYASRQVTGDVNFRRAD